MINESYTGQEMGRKPRIKRPKKIDPIEWSARIVAALFIFSVIFAVIKHFL